MRKVLTLATAVLLAGCGGSDPSGASTPAGKADAVAPVAATGSGCAGIYGNPPRQTNPSLQGQLASLYYLAGLCELRGGEELEWSDPDGTPRLACLFAAPQAGPDNPLPLVTFLGGSIFPGDPQAILSGLEASVETYALSGDASRPGFSLLIVEGRDKEHFYPFPDDHALGFDNWYRNFDRNDPALNVDAATIDHYIAEVAARGIVDAKRRYMMGWSNGASMALLYGLNTPGIAATAVYSSPEPFSDVADPCAQPPFGDNLRPQMTVHNACDIIGLCQTGALGYRDRIAVGIPQLELRTVLIDELQNETGACVASCAYDGESLDLLSPGSLYHLRWPTQWNDDFLGFLRDRPLP